MSVKAMGLVWDFPCPQTINEMEFKPNHKYVLQAYADHADHNGKSIWPSIKTIAEKTGYDERTIQRITADLEKMGLLIEDGMGPRGTNRWRLPFDEKARQIVTPDKKTGDKDEDSLGDISLGDISLGDKMSYEFNEPEPKIFNISNIYIDIWGDTKNKIKNEIGKAAFETWVKPTQPVHFDVDNSVLWIECRNDFARRWLTNHFQEKAQDITGLFVRFLTVAENEMEPA